MKKIAFFLLCFLFAQLSFGQTTIASQDFEGTPASPTMTFVATDFGTPTNNGGYSSNTLPAGNRPVGSNLFASGAQGYRVVPSSSSLAGQTLTFSAVNTSGYTNIQVSYRVAAMSIGTANGGMDTTNDQVLLEVSPDGGTTWFQQSRVNIINFNNSAWDFTGATGIGTRDYLANNSLTTHSTTPTANAQTVTGSAAITTVIVTNLPAVNNLQVRITPQTNSTSEAWYIDDVIITGTVVTSDTTPPSVSTFSPLDDATGASITGDLTINFNENVAKGTGNILIKKTSDNSIFETIDVTTAAVSVSGATVTINPAATFDNLTGYYVEIPATAFKDAANNFYLGISLATAWDFTTIGISSITVADNGTQVAAAVVAQGASAHVLHKFSLAVSSVNTALTGVQVTTAGTYTTADLTNLKVRYSTDATLNASDATLSTYTSVPTAGTLTFPSFVSQAINAGSTGYIFITADVTEGATLGNTISVGAVTTAQLSFSGGIKSGSTSAGGAQAVAAKIITFDFVALAGNEATANSNFNSANLTSSTISRGAGLTATANGARFNSQNWALTDIATAILNNDYVEFTITPNAGYQFSVSSIVFNIMRSATSFTGIALRSSVDNYASNLDAEKAIVDIADVTEIITFNFSQANSSTPVTYRLFGWAESTGGSGGFEGTGNDIIVTGTTEATLTTWTGATSNVWSVPGNWTAGLPNQNSDVTIVATANQPVIGSNVNINSLTITSGNLTVNAGRVLTVSGTVTNAGDLILESTTAGTANLLSGSSAANVTQQRYLASNQRGWRLLSNPLSTITFGTLATNSTTPITLGANASGSYVSATNTWTSGTDADNMVSQQGYKVFLRGRTSEVTGSSYSVSPPSNVTLAIKGTATNTAPATVTTAAGKFYLVANPYTAPVSLYSILGASTGLSTTVSYYNPTIGSSGSNADLILKYGGYATPTITAAAQGDANDVVLPPMGAIFVQATSVGTINVPKTAIFTGTPLQVGTYNHKTAQTKATTNALKISVMSGSTYYDALNVQFKAVGDAGSNIDFGKLPNTILDFYSIIGSTNMAVSELELKDQVIPLGITSTVQKSYTLNVAENTIPAGFEAELIDNVLNTKTALTPGTNYNFTIDSTPFSQGNTRFAINLKTAGTLSVTSNELDSKIQLWPNPAHNQINILNSDEVISFIEISTLNGQVIHTQKANPGATTTIQTNGWEAGVYILKATNNGVRTIKKLIIQ